MCDGRAMLAGLRAHPGAAHVFAWGDEGRRRACGAAAGAGREPSPAQREQLAQAERDAAVTANDIATICWTSGTEAAPRACRAATTNG